MRRLGVFGALCLFLLSGRSWAADPWPFDQRQILLVRGAGQAYPDDMTVAQIMDQFVARGRVRWVTQKAGPLVPVEVPADFPWYSAGAVRSLGLRYKVDGIVHLIRRGVQIDMRWYSTLDGQPLYYETLGLPEAGPGEEATRKQRLVEWVRDIWRRIPGRGYVVARDLGTLTLEGGVQEGLKVGDRLELRRLQEIRRHPTLRTLLGIESSVSGQAVVQSVGEQSIARVESESSLDPIQLGDRYLVRVVAQTAAAATPSPSEAVAPSPVAEPSAEEGLFSSGRLLDVSLRALSGISRHTESVEGGTDALEMSGFTQGFELATRLYLTREWLVGLEGAYAFMNFGRPPAVYAAGSAIGGSSTALRTYGAYRIIFIEDSEGLGYLELGGGYGRLAYSLDSTSSVVAPSSKTYSGLDLQLALSVPVLRDIGAYFRGVRSFSVNLQESPKTGGAYADSVNWTFDAGATYRLNAESKLSAGLSFVRSNSSFEGLGTRTTRSLSTLLTSSLFHAAYSHSF